MKNFKIGDKITKVPLIQGGMGVGISLGSCLLYTSTRDKLLSYLSTESIRHSSLSFDIPFDRQQLADYLCIDRAAMSTEISKLQKEGFIKTNRNHFELTVCNNSDSEIKMWYPSWKIVYYSYVKRIFAIEALLFTPFSVTFI